MSNWTCPYCGGKNLNDDRSCPSCGCMQQDAPQPIRGYIFSAPVTFGKHSPKSRQAIMDAMRLDYDAEVQRKLRESAVSIGTLCPPTPRPSFLWRTPDTRDIVKGTGLSDTVGVVLFALGMITMCVLLLIFGPIG